MYEQIECSPTFTFLCLGSVVFFLMANNFKYSEQPAMICIHRESGLLYAASFIVECK